MGAQVVDTAAVRREVDSLIRLNADLTKKYKLVEALQVIELAKTKVVETFGKNSYDYGNCLFSLGITLQVAGRFKESELVYIDAMAVQEFVLGKEQLKYARMLDNLGVLYLSMNRFGQAEAMFKDARYIHEKNLGKENADYAMVLSNISALYIKMGRFVQAEPYIRESMGIREKILGKETPEYATNLFNLGTLYMMQGKVEQAEPYLQEAKNIREKTLSKDHPDYALSLTNLGVVEHNLGRLEPAEVYFLEAISIYEKTLGTEHSDYALIVNNLASIYFEIGELEKAELLYIKSKYIWANKLGKDSPQYALSLINLANISYGRGRLDESEKLCLESMAVFDKTANKHIPEYVKLQNSLGNVYMAKYLLQDAENLYRNAKDLLEQHLGTENLDYVGILSNLATLYVLSERYDSALAFAIQAQTLCKKVIGKYNFYYVNQLNRLALLFIMLQKPEQAEALFLDALTIWDKALGHEHQFYRMTLQNIAAFHRSAGHNQKAAPYFENANRLAREELLKSVRFLSERNLGKYATSFANDLDGFYSFSQTYSMEAVEFRRTCYDNALFYKGFLLLATNTLRRLTKADTTTMRIDLLQKACHRMIAKEYAKPLKQRNAKQIDRLEAQADSLELEMIQRLPEIGSKLRGHSWNEVRDNILYGAAAVEFIAYRYHPMDFHIVSYYNQADKYVDSTLYAALVLLPTDTAPHFIPLFEERQLLALFQRPGFDEQLTVKGLYGSKSELLNLLWKPLEPLLRDVKTIYYSPAGLLHRINPAALLDADKQPLSAGRQWVRVGSTRELVTGRLADRSFARTPESPDTPEALVFGGIRYDMDSTAFVAANPLDAAAQESFEIGTKDGKFRYMAEEGLPELPAGLRGGGDEGWKPLAGGAREAEQVGELLRRAGVRTGVLSGYAASEERFKNIGKAGPSPRILHMATHGFAYPDPKKEPQRGFIGQEPVYKLQDDPMLRSGLLLAGANHYWANKRPLDQREDGVLVAYEVRDLNLLNTELAVLSACQTGLGDVVGSEGVYGLQRAFRIAGAKYLIVSLWQVPDEQTQELMRLFYENWVDKQQSLRDAFNNAQAELREREPNPYLWAGFVLIE